METLVWFVGVVTVIVSILVKLVGLPDQLRKNNTQKSTQGMSSLLIGLLGLSYFLWTLYGVLKVDWFLIIGHGIGVVTTGAILFQVYHYRKRI